MKFQADIAIVLQAHQIMEERKKVDSTASGNQAIVLIVSQKETPEGG
jgi:hypothetical protein